VIGYVVFENFIEMFSNIDGTLAGWKKGISAKEMADDMGEFYSLEEQRNFGVMGIFLC
jgi:hypothetical protein